MHHSVQLFSDPIFKYRYFVAEDGCSIRYALSFPSIKSCRGMVLILHGKGEFIEKYKAPASRLLARGFAIATMDWRGQGLSCRMLKNQHKCHIDSFSQHLADLNHFLFNILLPLNLPVSIVAHSMGGHLALRFMAQNPNLIRKAILSAPMIDIHLPFGSKKVVRQLAQKVSKTQMKNSYVTGTGDFSVYQMPFAMNRLTHDQACFMKVRSEIKKNSGLATGGVTWAWLNAAFESIKILQSEPAVYKIKTPVVIAVAMKDTVVCPKAAVSFVRKYQYFSILKLASSFHEIMFETPEIQQQFWHHFDLLTAVSIQ